MTSIDDGAEPPVEPGAARDDRLAELEEDREDAHPYFRAIEDIHLNLRGGTFLLSPNDWQITKGWFEAGIPVAFVEHALEEVFAKRERAGKGPINSLRYARKAVEKAWEEHRTLQAAAAPAPDSPGLDLERRLSNLALALSTGLPEVDSWRQRILALRGDAETVERELGEIDDALLEVAEAALDKTGRAAVEARLASSLESLRPRLASADLERATPRLRNQILRDHWRLPLLSLFGADAVG